MKKYRFFFHYNKNNKGMTLHYRGQCIFTKNIQCNVPCETKWNKIQPQLVMRGWTKDIEIKDDIITIH